MITKAFYPKVVIASLAVAVLLVTRLLLLPTLVQPRSASLSGKNHVSAAFATTRSQTAGFRILSGKRRVTVPFELFEDDIVIPVTINSSKPVWFLLDTGAAINVINKPL